MKISLTCLIMIFAIPAFAETTRIDNRKAHQEKRIEQGEKSGQLTDQEAAHLENQQNKIAGAEQAAAADGTVTHQEKRKINRMQNRASHEIYKEKHNKRSK